MIKFIKIGVAAFIILISLVFNFTVITNVIGQTVFPTALPTATIYPTSTAYATQVPYSTATEYPDNPTYTPLPPLATATNYNTPTIVPQWTYTAENTPTPRPTLTLIFTNTPRPTKTPYDTATPYPTYTPVDTPTAMLIQYYQLPDGTLIPQLIGTNTPTSTPTP